MDKPVLGFISAVLDITAVKPLIECSTGYDMITGEDLSDFERRMKAVSGVVSLFTLGPGSIVMNRGKLALGESVKLGAKNWRWMQFQQESPMGQAKSARQWDARED